MMKWLSKLHVGNGEHRSGILMNRAKDWTNSHWRWQVPSQVYLVIRLNLAEQTAVDHGLVDPLECPSHRRR